VVASLCENQARASSKVPQLMTRPDPFTGERTMSDQPSSAPKATSVLVLYGDPPNVIFRDPSGRVLSNGFTLTRHNQASFEAALLRGLTVYFGHHVGMSEARLVRIHDATDFLEAIRKYNPSHLVYDGHALVGSNTLLPALGIPSPRGRLQMPSKERPSDISTSWAAARQVWRPKSPSRFPRFRSVICELPDKTTLKSIDTRCRSRT
jgi:hypothetical protein